MRDLYEILGVPRDATEDDIKRAYRRKARALHPDAGGEEEAFKELTTAYEVLRNPQARANFDRYGDPRGVGADPFAGVGDLGDLIDAFFGGFGGMGTTRRTARPRAAQGGRDAMIELALTLEEAAAGVRREVDVTVQRSCPACEGTGGVPGSRRVRCATCDGAGAVRQVTQSVFGQMLTSATCPACRGTGEGLSDPCPTCSGEGRQQGTETLTVEVPPGVDDGTQLRVSGQGEAGRRGGAAGDLYVRIRVPEHELFRREGNDLHCELRVPMTQAALGTELKLPTLDGEEVVRVPRGAQTGDVIVLRRHGMPKLGGGGARGDLHVHCRVETPTRLTGEQEELLRRLADLRREHGQGGETRGLLGKLRDAFGW